MKPLYQNNFTLVQVLGKAQGKGPSGFITKDQLKKNKEQSFDDSLFFMKAAYVHLDKIEIFVRDGFI